MKGNSKVGVWYAHEMRLVCYGLHSSVGSNAHNTDEFYRHLPALCKWARYMYIPCLWDADPMDLSCTMQMGKVYDGVDIHTNEYAGKVVELYPAGKVVAMPGRA